ncbi:MAG: hypothetical protein JWO08_249, partial [Verrucomicrobiaceae bacterium]|nr:hypothetical protein [Verrucomicrobiaceae bacterium]
WFRNKFFAGLAVATPLILTYWILQFVYDRLHGWSEPILLFSASRINDFYAAITGVPNLIDVEGKGFIMFEDFIGAFVPIVVLVAMGAMASHVIGVRVVEAVDRLLMRIPFISFIYKSLKQVIDAFKGLGGKQGFKRVVYVDYPTPGTWMLGFVTGQFYDRMREKHMTCVFLPCAPSPMTGLLLVVEDERISDAPMTMEEAMKMIFSGGLVGPESLTAPLPKPAVQPTSTRDLPAGLPTADDFELGVAKEEVKAAAPVLATVLPTPVPVAAAPTTNTGKVSLARALMPWKKA